MGGGEAAEAEARAVRALWGGGGGGRGGGELGVGWCYCTGYAKRRVEVRGVEARCRKREDGCDLVECMTSEWMASAGLAAGWVLSSLGLTRVTVRRGPAHLR